MCSKSKARGNLIALSANIRGKNSSNINNTKVYLKKLEKEKQFKQKKRNHKN